MILKNLFETFQNLPYDHKGYIATEFIIEMIFQYHSYPKVNMKSLKKHGNRK
jgi:hypothetical protein